LDQSNEKVGVCGCDYPGREGPLPAVFEEVELFPLLAGVDRNSQLDCFLIHMLSRLMHLQAKIKRILPAHDLLWSITGDDWIV